MKVSEKRKKILIVRRISGKMSYGKELIIDLHKCDVSKFNRKDIEQYFIELCDLIDMERCDLHFWDDEEVPKEEKQIDAHTKGTSAVQFILTSNITIHTLDILKNAYINIFSCKHFDSEMALAFTKGYFKGSAVNWTEVDRL